MFTLKTGGPMTITYTDGSREVIPAWRVWLAHWLPLRRWVTKNGRRID